ncbi:aminoacyl-tRNA deacylase [Ligilactobacillus apodemi]|uniref:Cys-tRNA(Pro)/Cys-tRNA(Cys) deacylase n=1 Tax=Ligilactobacillus apodemi DSM 16634 = JCM 16172 TaxID=1423724 RepID=A0A0R1TQ27_9LACO|nr:aminoacyl-tRNA deacylase [Ligilactobacillus apodemi]KRL83549.1 transcriptional regulator [Ligilactobacillus apodemi DSM 16634 = JCM 16172]MBD5069686.1 aminoacyl-tRNA deacylase [Lactobacillus sp.]MCR1900401.1 aminoacyl-tRNA deacylase [Ligilactobacillus apodemi]
MAKKNKKIKEKKTNDERILDQHNITYREANFEWLTKHQSALEEAKAQGVDPKSILKTIVLQANKDPKDYVVVCLPIEYEIDLKLTAQQLQKKQLHLADNKNLINITGYIHGANTPIGISVRKNFPVYFDERIKPFEEISVSAGKVGRSVRLKQSDLVNLVKGKYIQVSKG